MEAMLTKKRILAGIRTCAAMESLWYNDRRPDGSWSNSIKDIRHILEDLLILAPTEPKKKHSEPKK